MKLTLVLAGFVALLISVPAQAQTTYIGCATGAETVKPYVAPSSCNTWYPGLSHNQTDGTLTHMRWRNWGSPRATATAIMVYDAGRTPTSVTVSRPRSIYGMRAYTRLTTKTQYGSGTMGLPWGYGLWPLL